MDTVIEAEPESPPETRPSRWKRILRYVAITIVVLLLCAALVLKDHIRTLNSLRRVPGTNAYVMDYYVDYNIDEVRAHGININHIEDSFLAVFFPDALLPIGSRLKEVFLDEDIAAIPPDAEHCSTVVLRTDRGHVFFGRNFDYMHDHCLILKIHGNEAASSVAVLDLHYLNLDRDNLENTSIFERIPLLFAPYYLQDGMNQYGVAVADMSVDSVEVPYDAAKPNLIHSTAMRLILDYAKTTDEAVEILRQYNIHFVGETCHLMIADATGKSQVVEFVGGQLKLTGTKEGWQVCTNHRLCERSEDENDNNCVRYRRASDELTKLTGQGSADDVMNVMEAVAQKDSTMWSSVYNLSTGDFRIAYRQHFDQPYVDHLKIAN